MTRVKLDLDGPWPRDWWDRASWILATLRWRVRAMSIRRSPGGSGWHVELLIAGRIHPWRVVAAQILLGSDWKRETFNLARLAQWSRLSPAGRRHWNVLFTRKWSGRHAPVSD